MTVNILGTKYSIYYKSSSEDKFLRECDGYCDKSSKKIVVTTENIELENFAEYQKKMSPPRDCSCVHVRVRAG